MVLLPDFDAWSASEDRDNQITNIEARVQNIKSLKSPKEAVSVRGTEDAEYE